MVERNAIRVAWADTVRAVGTLYIVGFWHIHKYIGDFFIKNIYTKDITFAVLALFFFLSGYFLGKSEISNVKNIFTFYKLRLKKSYPLYVIACFSMAFIIPAEIHGARQIGLSLVGLSCLLKPAPDTLWFYSLLLLFYFVTPFILFDRDSMSGNAVFMLRIMGIYLGIFVFHLAFESVDDRVFIYYPAYFGGLLGSKFNISFLKNKYRSLLITIIGYGICILARHRSRGGIGDILTLLVVICLMIIIVAISFSLSGYTIVKKITHYVSYGGAVAYLFHRQYYEVLYNTTGYFGLIRGFMLYLPLLIILSYFIQHVIDYFFGYAKLNR